MAAGLGFKTFTTGEVLTAGDVNGYLMQGINVFANTTARNAAITSPQEGQFAFTKDTNSLWYYDGAAWVASGATGDIEGVTAGVGISGGGTSGTVTVTNSMATAIDAKGDLVAGTGADTFARLAVGANNTVLTADSTEATGLKWAASAGYNPNYSLLNSGGTALSGVTTRTISGISGVNDLFIIVAGASADGGAEILIRLNTDTGANYFQRCGVAYAASTASQDDITTDSGSTTSLLLGRMSLNGGSVVNASAQITGTNSAGLKMVSSMGTSNANGGNYAAMITSGGYWSGSATVTSVSIVSSSANFDAGTVYVYAS